MIDFPFEDGFVHLPDNWDATFDVVTSEDMILPCNFVSEKVLGVKEDSKADWVLAGFFVLVGFVVCLFVCLLACSFICFVIFCLCRVWIGEYVFVLLWRMLSRSMFAIRNSLD